MTDDELKAYLDSRSVSDEPETEEERQAWAEGLADLAAGRVVPHEEVLWSLGITGDSEPVSEA
jgi:predicted transcriptional regulator